jgi:hypothetical protein
MKGTISGFFFSIVFYGTAYGQWTNGSANINNTNAGNVGIGTANPRAALDVGRFLNYAELGSVLGRLSEGDGNGEGTYLGVRGYDSQVNRWNSEGNVKSFAIEHGFYNIINNINFFRGGNTAGGFITFNTSTNVEQMRIAYNGNVGIGTTNPQDRLAVNGTIHSKEVKVDMTGWPDYVFSSSYELPTLIEIKKYIAKNNHLPDFPTASDVTQQGLKLGETTKLLTKKIEELTLYLIEKEEQLLKQEKINTELSFQSAQQDTRLKALEQSLSKLTEAMSLKSTSPPNLKHEN